MCVFHVARCPVPVGVGAVAGCHCPALPVACGFMSFTFAKIILLNSDVKFYHAQLYAQLLCIVFPL